MVELSAWTWRRGRYPVAGKVVLVTGPARGIGRALAIGLHRRGAHLALAGIEPDALAHLEAALGERARAFPMDVTDAASVERAMGQAVAHFGRLDVVVANAGITSVVGAVETVEPERFEQVVDVNFLGVYRTLRAAIPHVVRSGGYLLAVSSTAAGLHPPLSGHYAASKAAVAALCDSLRLELRATPADVGVVFPTFVAKGDDRPDPIDHELSEHLWGEHRRGGAWDRVSVDTVVARVIRGIERRSRAVVVPRVAAAVVWFPGIAQPLFERAFPAARMQRLMRAAADAAARRRQQAHRDVPDAQPAPDRSGRERIG